jgi:hypothetical protein
MSIDAALLGTVIKDAGLRTSAAGKPRMALPRGRERPGHPAKHKC